jgi:alpha-L-fucosidase
MKTTLLFFSLWVLDALCTHPIHAQPYQPNWESLDKRPVPTWFADAKFGIFIHWGVYSVPAYRPVGKERYASYAEWYQVDVMNKPGKGKEFHDNTYGRNFAYRDFAPMFRAELFNPQDWAKLFKNAGARYVVLTSKHHDGFALWPTKSPYNKGWNSVATGPRRDLVGDVTRAVRAEGLKMGLYFSILEWESPTPSREEKPYLPKEVVQKYRIPPDQYVGGHILPQLKELVTNYQPAIIFSDGAWDEPSDYWQSQAFLAWLYNNAPNKDEVVVNDRWGKDAHQKHGDYYTSEYGSDNEKVGTGHPWEENQGIGGSYGFNRAENLEDYKTSGQLVHLLIDRVSRGGNLILNVGPAADGTIPVIMQERLLEIGNWLKINGEAIYSTHHWDAAPKVDKNTTTYFTRKGNDLYLITTKWQAVLSVEGVSPGAKVSLLGYKGAIQKTAKGGKLTIQAPTVTPETVPCQYAWVYKLEKAL